jgi:lysophospholipid acyltransferase (LPLAT)-like uncharacterized protein
LKALFVYWIYRLLMATWRVRLHQHPLVEKQRAENKPVVLAHWHGDELALIHLVKPLKLATMTSTSSDGSIVDFVIKRLGGATARGSSTRGGIGALKGLVRLLKQGRITSMAVDGPRGPYHVVKPGVFELSRLSGAAVVPVGVYVKTAKHFPKSWNKTYLPLPFAQIQIVFDAPLASFQDGADPRDQGLAQALAERLNAAGRQAAKLFAAP